MTSEVHAREVDYFQTERKLQDPENGHLSDNALHGQKKTFLTKI